MIVSLHKFGKHENPKTILIINLKRYVSRRNGKTNAC